MLTGDMTAHLGERKLNYLYTTLSDVINVHKQDGEGWFQATDIEWLKSWLLKNRTSLGIFKRVERCKDSYVLPQVLNLAV